MPAYRNIPTRRSERLSHQELRCYHDNHDWETFDLNYPSHPDTESDATPESLVDSISSLSLSGSADDPDSLLSAPFVPSPSHARRRKANHVPRPPNAFMIFRSDLWRKRKLDPDVTRDHRHISRIAGMCWKKLSPEEQRPYQFRAKLEKERHALENPGYKYSPVVRKQKSARKKTCNDVKDDKDKCKKLASMWMKDFGDPNGDAPLNAEIEATTCTAPTLSTPALDLSITSGAHSSSHSLASSHTLLPITTEADHTQQLTFSSSFGFVMTEEIPPLDLAHVANTDDAKPHQLFDPDLQPPKFSPSYVDPHFGVKPDAVDFTHSYMLSMNQDNNIDEEFSLGLGNLEPSMFPSFLSDTAVDLQDPITSQRFHDAPFSFMEHSDESIFPTMTGDHVTEPREIDFGVWFKFE